MNLANTVQDAADSIMGYQFHLKIRDIQHRMEKLQSELSDDLLKSIGIGYAKNVYESGMCSGCFSPASTVESECCEGPNGRCEVWS